MFGIDKTAMCYVLYYVASLVTFRATLVWFDLSCVNLWQWIFWLKLSSACVVCEVLPRNLDICCRINNIFSALETIYFIALTFNGEGDDGDMHTLDGKSQCHKDTHSVCVCTHRIQFLWLLQFRNVSITASLVIFKLAGFLIQC